MPEYRSRGPLSLFPLRVCWNRRGCCRIKTATSPLVSKEIEIKTSCATEIVWKSTISGWYGGAAAPPCQIRSSDMRGARRIFAERSLPRGAKIHTLRLCRPGVPKGREAKARGFPKGGHVPLSRAVQQPLLFRVMIVQLNPMNGSSAGTQNSALRTLFLTGRFRAAVCAGLLSGGKPSTRAARNPLATSVFRRCKIHPKDTGKRWIFQDGQYSPPA